MRRTIWLAVGAAAGALAVSRARRASEALTYDGLTDRLAGLFAGARVFGEEVASAAARKETDLRARWALGHNDHSADVIELFPSGLAPAQITEDDANQEGSS